MIGKGYCLIILLALLAGSIALQYRKSKLRKKLVERFDVSLLGKQEQLKWDKIERSHDFILKDFRKLRILLKHRSSLSTEQSSLLNKYAKMNKIEIATTTGMLLFAAFAFTFCS